MKKSIPRLLTLHPYRQRLLGHRDGSAPAGVRRRHHTGRVVDAADPPDAADDDADTPADADALGLRRRRRRARTPAPPDHEPDEAPSRRPGVGASSWFSARLPTPARWAIHRTRRRRADPLAKAPADVAGG